jgi:hypothetical protein
LKTHFEMGRYTMFLSLLVRVAGDVEDVKLCALAPAFTLRDAVNVVDICKRGL